MRLFPCPFCGPRPETEFHFAVEAGEPRPEPAPDVSDAAWAAYLHFQESPAGESAEIWVHLTCGEFFLMVRDTIGGDVLRAESLAAPESDA